MTARPSDNMYFDGTQGWFGPGGRSVSFSPSSMIRIDSRSLMVALLARFGPGALNRVVFIDWSGGVYEGPYAGRRFGGYLIPTNEAAMWTERHATALQSSKEKSRNKYNEIHERGYHKVTLEVSPSAEGKWKWGTAYDPLHDLAGAKLWLDRR
ncbi:MAG TPA: hypothetical protein VD907_06220 [Verrucomicrobiae bacterium]|nr:hypothetical protein [Verrucomicrobiae bacterium]